MEASRCSTGGSETRPPDTRCLRQAAQSLCADARRMWIVSLMKCNTAWTIACGPHIALPAGKCDRLSEPGGDRALHKTCVGVLSDRYGDRVRYWLTLHEIDSMLHCTAAASGAITGPRGRPRHC